MQKPALSLRLHGHDKSHPLREGGTQTRDPRVFTSSGGWGGGWLVADPGTRGLARASSDPRSWCPLRAGHPVDELTQHTALLVCHELEPGA